MKLTYRQVLSRPAADGRCRVVLDVTWDGGRLKVPTGVSCQPAHFNAKALRPVSTKDPDSARLNAALAKVVARVEKAAITAQAEDRPMQASDLVETKTRRTAKPAAPVLRTPQEFYAAWLADNPNQPYHSARRYRQVVAHMDAYHPNWPVLQLTRSELVAYLAHLAELNLVDSTVSKHVRLLRECFRMSGLPVPGWLKLRVRYGRSPALQAPELARVLALHNLPADVAEERDLFLFQTFLLIRDSDLRQLRAHHVQPVELPGHGSVLVLTFRQAKTGDEVRVPLPPEAARIWQRWNGRPPLVVQQERNRRLKQLAQAAELTRPFVRVHYVQGVPGEEVLPLHKVITTHTARHTGADMLMLGSGGDSNLKEKALGHAGVYGHDALERYGPALLQAWEKVLGAVGATGQNAPILVGNVPHATTSNSGGGMVIRRFSYR